MGEENERTNHHLGVSQSLHLENRVSLGPSFVDDDLPLPSHYSIPFAANCCSYCKVKPFTALAIQIGMNRVLFVTSLQHE